MNDAFGLATGLADEDTVEQKFMKEYVDDKLGVKKDSVAPTVSEYVKEEDTLYALPEEIKVIRLCDCISLFTSIMEIIEKKLFLII